MPLPSVLIGHTGFVGRNLSDQHAFDRCFNSTTIEQARGTKVGLLVCAGVRAEKWIANRAPEQDKAGIDRLMQTLRTMSAEEVVLISTTDVYADTRGKTELDPVDVENAQPYGKHRAQLELDLRDHFPHALIVRLPGLFGPYLKKNVIHDLLHAHEVEKINSDGIHQYYDIGRLWGDIEKARSAGIRTLNITSPPLVVRDVAHEVFGVEFIQPLPNPARYDMRSEQAAKWGGNDGYLYDRATVLADMKKFSAHHPQRRPLSLPQAR